MSLDLSNLSGGSNMFNCSGGGGGTGEEDLADGSVISGAGVFVSQNPLPAYVGFSAQSFSIPSIACDSDISHAALAERVSRQVVLVLHVVLVFFIENIYKECE